MALESSFSGALKAGFSTPRELAQRLSYSRRDFLRSAAGVALGSALMSASPFVREAAAAKRRKVIVITFGGGARDQRHRVRPQSQITQTLSNTTAAILALTGRSSEQPYGHAIVPKGGGGIRAQERKRAEGQYQQHADCKHLGQTPNASNAVGLCH